MKAFNGFTRLVLGARHDRRGLVERDPAVTVAADAADGDGLCGVDRHRRGWHRDCAEVMVLGDPASPLRILCIALILTGVIGLKLVSGDVTSSAEDS